MTVITTKIVYSAVVLMIVLVSADSQSTGQTNPTDEYHQVGPSRGFWPTVAIDKKDDKTDTSVHVPIFFDMQNIKDNSTGKHKLDLSVLGGLVTVNRDRDRAPNGGVSGPLTVTVFGIPVYSGYGSPKVASDSLPNVAEVSKDRTSNVQTKPNEKVPTMVNDSSSRLMALLSNTRTPSTSGPAANLQQPVDNNPRVSPGSQTANAI